MQVSQYMSQPVQSIAPDTDFHRAYDMMVSRGIHHLPVVDGERLVGIVAERDLLLAAANFGSAQVPVAEIMHSRLITVSERATVKHAARLLVLNHIGSLPVVNSKKALVGIITETDMFKLTAGMLRPRQGAKTASRRAKPAARRPAAGKAAARKPAAKRVTRKR